MVFHIMAVKLQRIAVVVTEADPKRKERALSELAAKMPHVSIKPEKIDDTLGRSPQFEQEQTMRQVLVLI